MQMTDFQKILIFSDIHLTSGGKKIIGLNQLQKLQLAVSHALQNHPDSQHIVFTGDLAHEGDIEGYKALKRITKKIKLPITFMMGNHDNRKSFSEVFSEVDFDPYGFLQSQISINSFQLLFLDTLHESSSLLDKNKGFLCSKRLHWLDKKLNLAQNKKIIIFMHHPPFPVGFKAMDQIRLQNSESFFSILDQYNNIAHIISGHVHRTISGHFNGYGFSIFKSTCHQMPMQFDSENVKLSAAEPGAYGILFVQRDSLVVHNEDFDLSKLNNQIFENYD